MVSSVVVLSIAVAVFRMLPRALTRSFLTTGFVNVARYFDPAPGSHAARRAIRAGLVDLLSTLHQGRYARIVVVGHGLGGYIAYDALMTLWAETHELHAEPAGGLESLAGLEAAADRLRSEPTARDALTDFRAHQFALWQDLRRQGNPWRTTDFVTVGTPMALADLFIARPRCRRAWPAPGYSARVVRPAHPQGVVVGCPPRSEALPVDAEGAPVRYGAGATLGAHSMFAVTRWTNLWFPVRRGSTRGDWFGGELAGLFGPGVRDIILTGNRPQRLPPGRRRPSTSAIPSRTGRATSPSIFVRRWRWPTTVASTRRWQRPSPIRRRWAGWSTGPGSAACEGRWQAGVERATGIEPA